MTCAHYLEALLHRGLALRLHLGALLTLGAPHKGLTYGPYLGIELLMSHVKTCKCVLNPVNYCLIRCGLWVLKLWSMNIVLWSTCIRHLIITYTIFGNQQVPLR